MSLLCPRFNHDSKPLTLICSNPDCSSDQQRLACLRCLIESHSKCAKYILEVDKVINRDFAGCSDMLCHQDIKTAVKLVDKYDISDENEILQRAERRVEEEFEKLKEELLSKLYESKERVVQNLHERVLVNQSVDLKTFSAEMEEFYHYDAFRSIIMSLKFNEASAELINKKLDNFFIFLNEHELKKQRYSRTYGDNKYSGLWAKIKKFLLQISIALKLPYKKYNEQDINDYEIEKRSKALGKLLTDLLESDSKKFNEAMNRINFSMFDNYLKEAGPWQWNPDNKAPGIMLSDNNMVAKKSGPLLGYAAVGTMEMSSGVHIWEIDVATGSSDAYWIAAGIVDKNVFDVQGSTNLNYGATIGFATDSGLYQMTLRQAPEGYDNKTYTFELDMNKGVFTISCDGHVFAECNQNIEGKTFLPYVYLWSAGDQATLRVL